VDIAMPEMSQPMIVDCDRTNFCTTSGKTSSGNVGTT